MTNARKLVTVCNFPPIPDRRFDWCAYYEGHEEDGQYGYGATEAEAVADFVENYIDEEEEAQQRRYREREAEAKHYGGLSLLGEELAKSLCPMCGAAGPQKCDLKNETGGVCPWDEMEATKE